MFSLRKRLTAAVVVIVTGLFSLAASAQETTQSAQVAWRLLDYIAVDYREAVRDGQVINEAEYAEMQEFSATARTRLAGLPPSAAQPELVQQADDLREAIDERAPADEVAARSRTLANAILAVYPTPLAPRGTPDLTRAAALYEAECAACHGVTGAGNGPIAAGLEPPPIDFTDVERARQRNLFGLFQVISQGLEDTSMPSYSQLPSSDRWSLAFYVGQFAFDESVADTGGRLWQEDEQLRARFPNLEAVTQATPALIAAEIGEPQTSEITAYLRRHPEAVRPETGPLDIARTKLAESFASYEAGDSQSARELAISAYLDGFELVEPALAARDHALLAEIETAMTDFRVSLAADAATNDMRTKLANLNELLDRADTSLARQDVSSLSSFLGSFTIILREGLEGLLIVVAMIALLNKADRRDVLPYVHGGWITALGAGILTWFFATYVITLSGASRELSEGFGSLIAALVLISVGIWMHGKAQADAWQTYVKEKLGTALSRGSAWFLFLLAFIVVYREVFETILFLIALWSQGAHTALIAGAIGGAVALAVAGWVFLSFSRRLPITQFFNYSALLIAALAVVLAGKGIAGLQEAGWLSIHPLAFLPRIEALGIYPTLEGAVAQIMTLTILIIGYGLNIAKARSVE